MSPPGLAKRSGVEAVPAFYGVEQAAGVFGVSSMTLYRAIAAGQFPAVRVRTRWVVPVRAVEAMISAAVDGWAPVDAADWVREGAA